jgi:hypothetical protein
MSFEKDLESLINKYSKENESNTPDYILAKYMLRSLENFNLTLKERSEWYNEPVDNIVTEIENFLL